MDEHKEELATIESLDSGAVYTLALKTHIGMSIDTLRYFAGWADKIQVNCLLVASHHSSLQTFPLLCTVLNYIIWQMSRVFHSVTEQYCLLKSVVKEL